VAPEAPSGGAEAEAGAAPKAKKAAAAAPKPAPKPPKPAPSKPAGVAKPKAPAAAKPAKAGKLSGAAGCVAAAAKVAVAKPAAPPTPPAEEDAAHYDSVEAFLATMSPAIPQARAARAPQRRRGKRRARARATPLTGLWPLPVCRDPPFAPPPPQAHALAAKLRVAHVTTGAQLRQLASFDTGVQVRTRQHWQKPKKKLQQDSPSLDVIRALARAFCAVLRCAAAGAAQAGSAGRVPGAGRPAEARVRHAPHHSTGNGTHACTHTRTHTHTSTHDEGGRRARSSARACETLHATRTAVACMHLRRRTHRRRVVVPMRQTRSFACADVAHFFARACSCALLRPSLAALRSEAQRSPPATRRARCVRTCVRTRRGRCGALCAPRLLRQRA
jgi:hypothetical protein